MPRIPAITRDELKPEDRHYFDRIAQSRGSVRGPYPVLLNRPKLAGLVSDLGAYVRFETDIPKALTEVVTLATAREIGSLYEFYAHVPMARKFGVSDETIGAIAQGAAPRGLSGDEELVVRYTQELLRDRKISDATFGAVKDRFGVQGTVDLTALIGHYLLVGYVLAAFEVEPSPGEPQEFPAQAPSTGSG